MHHHFGWYSGWVRGKDTMGAIVQGRYLTKTNSCYQHLKLEAKFLLASVVTHKERSVPHWLTRSARHTLNDLHSFWLQGRASCMCNRLDDMQRKNKPVNKAVDIHIHSVYMCAKSKACTVHATICCIQHVLWTDIHMILCTHRHEWC